MAEQKTDAPPQDASAGGNLFESAAATVDDPTTTTTTTTTARDDAIKGENTFNNDLRNHLIRRFKFKREMLIAVIENFVIDESERRVVLDDGEENRNADMLRLLRRRRNERGARDETLDRPVGREVLSMNIEQLNQLLHVLDDLYKQVVELINFDENAGVTLHAQNDSNVPLFLEILFVLIANDNIKSSRV